MIYNPNETWDYEELAPAINPDRVSDKNLRSLKDSKLIVCCAFCALVFSLLLFFVGNTVLTWSFLALIVVLLCGEVLALTMPYSIWQRSVANCVRSDGSWSSGRAKVEKASQARFKRNLVFVLLLVVTPSLFGLWVFNRQVIPIGIGAEALSSMNLDLDQWKSDLHGEEQRFDQWQESSAVAGAIGSEQHKRALWRSWPLIVAGMLVWCAAACTFVARYYIYCLGQFKRSVHARATNYRMHQMENQSRRKPKPDVRARTAKDGSGAKSGSGQPCS